MIVTPIVHFSYTPQKQLQRSTRYSQARNIQSLPNSASSGTFQILCCVHSEESARSIIPFLEASNPTNSSPICTYLVHLVDLVGSSAPQLTPYKKKKFRRLDSPSHQMMPIMPMLAAGVPGVVSGPTTNLNIGMDYWTASMPSAISPLHGKVSATATTGAMVPGSLVEASKRVPSEIWLQVFSHPSSWLFNFMY